MKAIVRAPGSCGELVQGTLDGKNFLITCPVEIYTQVTVCLQEGPLDAGSKTVEAVKKTLAYLGVRQGDFSVTVKSELPHGKGMASSSADISAACEAAARCVGVSLMPHEIADIALSIEPSDGIFYPGVVMFDHVNGLTRRELGNPPAITLAIFDVGGEVDTLQFNRRSDLARLNRDKEAEVRQAVELVAAGIATGDATLIGQGATLSALANQHILYKPCLNTIIKLMEDYGAVGVNTAHSGTVIGLLFPGEKADGLEACTVAVRQACPELEFLRTARLIPGGLTLLGGDGV